MTVGPDGQTLVVAVPKAPNSVYLQNQNPGDILILDFKTFNFKTGEIKAPIHANLPADNLSGKTPQAITATKDENRYLVANVSDYNRGLSTLTLTRDADGKIVSASMEAISLTQPTDKIFIDRLDIQRAQSAVLVEQNGVEYAIVSDDNYHFLDPYWKAMYEAPTFVFTPSGPPLAVGGSVSAKKVAVGGKLGIVKDPFGKQGAPEYLGATLPLDGYGIVNLSLSEDGKVVIGQLKGSYSGNILSAESLTQKPSQSHAWGVEALIAAALAQPSQDRLRKHIKLDSNAEQSIANPGGEFKGTIGTAFDPPEIIASITGLMGDVIEVDSKRIIAHALLKLPLPSAKLTLADQALIASKQTEINTLMAHLKEFIIEPVKKAELTDTDHALTRRVNLVTKNDAEKSLVLRNGAVSFKDDGTFYVVPNITDADENTLRRGDVLHKEPEDILITYKLDMDIGELRKGDGKALIKIQPNDYAPGTTGSFFGDRPLDNPGYSKITLSGNVGDGLANTDLLDVYRIEQRLKYLGFPAINNGNTSNPIEFKVDGNFTSQEGSALQLFKKVVGYSATATSYGPYSIMYGFVSKDSTDLDWLNAYNAPHWMQFFETAGTGYKAFNNKLGGQTVWTNLQTGDGKNNVFGTSWTFDLMRAGGLAKPATSTKPLQFNGAGELGMMINLGINKEYISENNQKKIDGNEKLFGLLKDDDSITQALKAHPQQWDFNNAMTLSDLLHNPNIKNTSGNDLSNSNGSNTQNQINDQTKALRDFLSLYTVTQRDNELGNGTWDDIAVYGGGNDLVKKEIIRNALFGNGTQAFGLINKDNLLLGGLGDQKGGIGAKLTAEMLAAITHKTRAAMVPWVEPLNNAMKVFEINTPKRIAAFLANLNAESGGFTRLSENTNWNLYAQDANGKYTQRFKNFITASAAVIAQYQPKSGDDKADYAYDGVNGNTLGTDDGHKYKGRGLIQLTGKRNYELASEGLNSIYGAGAYDLVNDYLSVSDDINVAALTSAWFWVNRANVIVGTKPNGKPLWVHRNLNDVADGIIFTSNNDAQNFTATEQGVRGAPLNERLPEWNSVNRPIYDQNAFGNMTEVLKALGITTVNKKDYNTQFGISLNKPTLQAIVIPPSNLMAEDIATTQNSEALLTQLQTEFDIQKGEIDMLIMDIPDIPLQQTPVIMMAEAVQQKMTNVYSTIGVCHVAEKVEKVEDNLRVDLLGVQAAAWETIALHDPLYVSGGNLSDNEFAQQKLKEQGKFNYYDINIYDATVKVLQQPKHGTLTTDSSESKGYYYKPNRGYIGSDKAIFLVNMAGYEIKVVYYFKIPDADFRKNDIVEIWNKYCPDPRSWLIPATTNTSSRSLSDMARYSDYWLSDNTVF